MMKRLGGARTTNAPPPAPFFQPLKDWDRYSYKDGGLTTETAARLLYERGPSICTLFGTRSSSTPSSCRVATGPHHLPGCRREDQEEERLRGQGATMHAVVCYAYDRSNRAGCVS